MTVAVVIENGAKKVFASALDWPGWSRGARNEQAAIDALLDYADRYRPVAERAGAKFPKRLDVEVVERCKGNGGTDFGVPMVAAGAESARLTKAQAQRQVALVQAAWDTLADVARTASETLRKGPRGGGRDRDAIVEHVREAEKAYASKLGIKPGEVPDLRAALVEVLSAASDGAELKPKGWTSRYAARRIAWHALDHAWEIEDKSLT